MIKKFKTQINKKLNKVFYIALLYYMTIQKTYVSLAT